MSMNEITASTTDREKRLTLLAQRAEETRAAWETAQEETSRLFKIAKMANDEFVDALCNREEEKRN